MTRPSEAEKKRIGSFRIDVELIHGFPEIVKTFFRKLDCIVIRAESHYSTSCVHYVAISNAFDAIEWNEAPPAYPVDVNYLKSKAKGTWVSSITLGDRGRPARRSTINVPEEASP